MKNGKKHNRIRQSEQLAIKLLEQLYPQLELQYNDTGYELSAVDIKLVDRKTKELYIALEVTTTTNEKLKKTIEITRQNKVIKSKKLKRCWHLWVVDDFCCIPKLSKKLEKLDNYLLTIEKSGIQKFYVHREGIYYDDVSKLCKELRIEAGISYKVPKGKILLLPPVIGGTISYSAIQKVVEKESTKQDNLNKLQKISNGERHLFIIVDEDTDYLTWKAMLDGCCPPNLPKIPPKIDIVWLVAWDIDNSYLIWRVSHANGWEILGKYNLF